MRHCRNFFEVGYLDGTFRITGNALPDAKDAHYVYISGSMHHDGVWEICNGYLTGKSIEGLEDEEFDGRVWLLAPPIDFLETVKMMREYEEKNPVSALASETFGGYSRTWATGGKPSDRSAMAVFRDSLAPHIRMYTEVK
jgi:hypothetical protein